MVVPPDAHPMPGSHCCPPVMPHIMLLSIGSPDLQICTGVLPSLVYSTDMSALLLTSSQLYQSLSFQFVC